jgi:hypothetical protein
MHSEASFICVDFRINNSFGNYTVKANSLVIPVAPSHYAHQLAVTAGSIIIIGDQYGMDHTRYP